MVCFSVLINGTPSNFFSSSRGLRQGTLYPLCFSSLSRMLPAIVDRGLLSCFRWGSKNNDKHLVSHLLFAEDTLFLSFFFFLQGKLETSL